MRATLDLPEPIPPVSPMTRTTRGYEPAGRNAPSRVRIAREVDRRPGGARGGGRVLLGPGRRALPHAAAGRPGAQIRPAAAADRGGPQVRRPAQPDVPQPLLGTPPPLHLLRLRRAPHRHPRRLDPWGPPGS